MPHLADRILTPSRFSAEGVLFDVPLRPYPGKPIVCMVPRETVLGWDRSPPSPLSPEESPGRGGVIHIPPEVADKYQPDFGVVAKFAPRLYSPLPSGECEGAQGPRSRGDGDCLTRSNHRDHRGPQNYSVVLGGFCGSYDDYLCPWDADLRPGMLVAVKPYTGVWYTHADFPWIPEGRILKILGTVEDWSQNILAAIEP